MLLKSIKIKDFRQFAGQQEPIFFSTDLEKNVTIIMGENGSGKTTLAQAFTWCLYGDTDFDDKIMLCKATSINMLPNQEETVRVDLNLSHSGKDYTVIREQRYSKDANGNLKRPNNTVLKISFKNNDGQQEFLKDSDTEMRMKEILPKDLAKYFFFDGERIGNMSKEIRKGKSSEFANAVKGLLGLSAFTAALDHLDGRSQTTVMKLYDKNYDSQSDSKIAQYTEEILKFDTEIDKIDSRLLQIENEKIVANDRIQELTERIKLNADSQRLAYEKDKLRSKLNGLVSSKSKSIKSMLDLFNSQAPSNFAKRMMLDALSQLATADKLDKGIPDIHARTIEFLIKRGHCICGNRIEINNEAYKELNKVLDYIPPQSIGSLINSFARESELKIKNADNLCDNILEKYAVVRDFQNTYSETEHDIKSIEEKLKTLESVGDLQRSLTQYETNVRKLDSESATLNQRKGSLTTSKDRKNTERHELTLKDETNRRIEIYKAYVQYMYENLNSQYKANEEKVRNDLKVAINEIFTSIYDGGFSLDIDEKYNVDVIVNDYQGYGNDIETSTAQSISVIFAFIAGVIKMARESQNPENQMLVSEPYPLVMDAPLSAFDKTRIQTICEALPKVAEQVIMFIKDTDGEIAEEFMSSKVGKRYSFDKKNEFETYLIERC